MAITYEAVKNLTAQLYDWSLITSAAIVFFNLIQ